jgi:N-acetylmuramoyl-L-alanine amidase
MGNRDRSGPYLAILFILLSAPPALSGQDRAGEAPAVPPSLSLDEALLRLGAAPGRPAAFRWDPFFRSGVLTTAGYDAAFETGNPGQEGLILLNSREILSAPAPYLEKGLLRFPEAFVTTLRGGFDALLGNDGSRFRIAAIIVDPGHGGKDSGAVGTHLINGKTLRAVEKDITLQVAKLLHGRLVSAFPDKQVLLTRQGDTYPTLEDRVDIANSVSLRENEAIVFISIHANASFNKNARGYEVWYLSPDYRRTVIDRERYADSAEVIPILNAMLEEEFTTESIIMAQSIMRGLDETLGRSLPSRGIKAEEWFVVRNARMPSILVELGFVTNQEDALLLTSDTPLRNFSEALYKGIVEFITLFEGSGGFIGLP